MCFIKQIYDLLTKPFILPNKFMIFYKSYVLLNKFMIF